MVTKNLKQFATLLLVSLITVGFTSCGNDNESDDPANPGADIRTNYGVVTPTGIKTFSLFASASNGADILIIPGFAPLRVESDYNIYKHVVVAVDMYSDDEGNDFAQWNPGMEIPTNWSKQSTGYSYLIRTRIKNSDSYVYCYVEKIRHLEESTGGMKGNVIGAIYKYQSPIDPNSFKGFSEN